MDVLASLPTVAILNQQGRVVNINNFLYNATQCFIWFSYIFYSCPLFGKKGQTKIGGIQGGERERISEVQG